MVAGANLPMLVRALSYSQQPLDVVIAKAMTGGQEGVIYIIPGEGNG
jgi:PTS system ascorbate-specific IIA component